MTQEDYEIFGPQLQILLESLRDLYNTCDKMPESIGMNEEMKKLGMNYSALYEINSDILNFRIAAPKDNDFSSLMAASTSALKRLAK